MNHTTNDYGQSVIAVGAPGSIERFKVERPRLIERLNTLYWEARAEGYAGRGVDIAIEMIRAAGIADERETNAVQTVYPPLQRLMRLADVQGKDDCWNWKGAAPETQQEKQK